MRLGTLGVVATIATAIGVCSTGFAMKPLHINSQHKVMTEAHSFDSSQSLFIIQFDEKVTESVKEQLKNSKIEVINYIPEDALLVKTQSVEALSKMNGVARVVPFQSSWKKSTALPAAHTFNANQQAKLMLKTASERDLFEQPLTTKFRVIESSGKYHFVEVAVKDIEALAKDDSVLWIDRLPEIEPMVVPLIPETSLQQAEKQVTGYETGTRVMKFEAAWNRGWDGSGQSVAMADTGLDHGVVGKLSADFSTVRKGHKFGLFAKDWSDSMGHGTHVAGSVMSQGTASDGVFIGGAYGAEMIPQGMWSPVMNNMTVPPKLGDMLTPAYNDGARIHTNSWGSPRDLGKYHSYCAQVDEFMWEHPDMLVVFAAGNSGEDNNHDGRVDAGSVSFPGTAKNILTVGASENYLLEGGIQRPLKELKGGEPWGAEPLGSDTLSNNENGIAAFSSRGPTADGRLKPDVVAPGTNIVSNCSPVTDSSPLWGHFDDNYCYSGGTSMSTPLTAGAAAVTRQFLIQQLKRQDISAALVKAVLMNGAVDLYPGQYGEVGKSAGQELLVAGPNNDQGYGRVNMDHSTNSERFIELVDNAVGVQTGEVSKYTFDVPASGSFKVTLVYTDAPGEESTTKALVNDLDLSVTVGGVTLQSQSRTNNTEQLVVENQSGLAEVYVRGFNVPMGKNGAQPFALVISQ